MNITPIKSLPRWGKSSWVMIAFCAVVLSACGVRGAPEIPPPLWGDAEPKQPPASLPEKTTNDDEYR